MHQPRPHGTFGTDSEEDAAALELLARRLTNAKTLSGVDSLRMSRTLPSGAMAVATDAGGIFKVITQQPLRETEPQFDDGLAKPYIPALFSGVIKTPRVRDGEGVAIELTEQARRRLSGYGVKQESVEKVVQLQRFRVGYNYRVQEFVPENPGPFLYTQYAAQRPTWYSGAMAEVIQVVGGYGRQDLSKLPDDKIERARMTLPDKVQRQVELEMGSKLLPGYAGKPDKTGEFQYDYKFNETNGVGFDAKERPWLLRVNTRGVFAMPLPLVPATTMPAFRAYMEEMQDDEILWTLDRFGGMPSGEGMPFATKDFEAWRRAGVIIKVCDAGDFYQHPTYSTACGWSFNARGSEGFNTCYDYDEDEGLGYGLAYKLRLRLEAAEDDGRLPTGFDLPDALDARTLDAYLSSLYRTMGAGGARERAIKYKLRRALSQVLSRMGKVREASYDPTAEVDFWDNLELEPIATHGGNVARVGKGWLYHPAPFENQPQIKFPEPFMGGCVSHNFSPLVNGVSKKSFPRCDTIMFGYYAGDQLKVIKYFRDDRQVQRGVEGNFEECMIVGAWEQTVTHSPSMILGSFYTSDIDDRVELAASQTVTKVVGRDLGYDSKPFFEFDAMFSMPGTIVRNRYYSTHTNTEKTSGRGVGIHVCIPYLCRNALIYAKSASTVSGESTKSALLGAVRDPNSYRYWTHDSVMHWFGGQPWMDSRPYPKNSSPVWVETHSYSPGGCSDFADRGQWIPLPSDYTWLVHPEGNTWYLSGGGGAPKFKNETTRSLGGSTSESVITAAIGEWSFKVGAQYSLQYTYSSPSTFDGVFYRDAALVVAGSARYSNVMEPDPEAPKQRKRFGHTRLADHKSAHHFIGVINE